MKITFFQRTDGGCDFYRAIQPLTFVAEHMKDAHKVTSINTGEFNVGLHNDEPTILSKTMDADVLVVPRMWGAACFQELRKLNPRAKIVLEYDDNLFEVSPWSPHYAEHGVEEVEIDHQGQKLKLWEDGRAGFSLETNRRAYAETLDILGQADLVTTTTDILAEQFKKWNPNVAVLPNCVDFKLWQKLPFQNHGEFRMGWFGGHSHYEDWLLLRDVLPSIMQEFPHVKLVIMGARFDGVLKGLPADRIEYHPWVPTPAYPYKAAILNLDLALIPLQNTPFNQCKSAIKWIEMAALKVPAVTSMVSPYKEVATDGNGMWIDGASAEVWIAGIKTMLQDPLLRSKVAFEAFQTAKKEFDIFKNYHRWVEAYEKILVG